MSETAYIGVVGPSMDYSTAWTSIVNIARRDGDDPPNFSQATKGFEARQHHINKFLESTHDWLLMLDHDMTFERDTLERLRSHNVTYVSGLYMRRTWAPMVPIWFDYEQPWQWPVKPFMEVPERGKLHRINASGWGCVLLHRSVIEDTRPLLKGEAEVIEDDMDLWPYDLERVKSGLFGLRAFLNGGGVQDGKVAAQMILDEIQPLRGRKTNVGSDIRFPFFARQAGHQLWGDPDVRPGHITQYPLTPDDFEQTPPAILDKWQEQKEEAIAEARASWA